MFCNIAATLQLQAQNLQPANPLSVMLLNNPGIAAYQQTPKI